MRADRLIALLMLLQRNQQMSGQALSDELGVSVRTIYRDIEALCAAGIPIYAEYGVNGGYRLVENYRTTLTGLTQNELNALLLLKIPEPLASLEAGHQLKTALLKLYAALLPGRERLAQQRIYLDWAGWGQGQATAPHLQKLYQAVCEDRKVILRYRLWNRPDMEIQRVVEPYGLVAKAGVWILIYAGDGRLHSHRVTELADAHLTDEPFARPADFDLEVFWKTVVADIENDTRRFPAVVRISPDMLPDLPRVLGRGVAGSESDPQVVDANGWANLELTFDSLEAARAQILGMGGAVEVIAPEALRLSVRDFAEQIIEVYANGKQQN